MGDLKQRISTLEGGQENNPIHVDARTELNTNGGSIEGDIVVGEQTKTSKKENQDG